MLVPLRYFARILKVLSLLLLAALPTPAPAMNVLTQHNNNFRTGANLSEYVLTVSNVNTGQFGKLFSRVVDGQIYAQPLYVNGLIISNKFRNVLYVATEHNSVYAFDADDPAASNALWQVNLGPSVPIADIDGCNDLTPEIGITSSPVIDPTSNTIYVDAKTKEVTNSITSYFHRLHALDLVTGQEHFGGPVAVQGAVPGTGTGSVDGTLPFNPRFQHNRAGLLLLSNTVYVAFGSHCDFEAYHGWMFGYNATNLQQTTIFNTTPNAGSDSGGGGIWGSGMGPSADVDGNIYVTTGNATFDKNTGGPDLGDSLVKLSVSNGTLVVTDWFAPHDQTDLFTNDLDLAAGGPVVIPSTNVLIAIGKTGVAYLLDRQHLGGFVDFSSDTNIVQEFTVVSNAYFIGQCPVYWRGPTNEFLFFWTHGMVLSAYSFNGSLIATNPVATGSTVQNVGRVGGTSLSAHGNAPGSGIVWGTEGGNGGTLHAYDATNVAHELWNSQQIAARDALGIYTKFCAPTIANGKVYVATCSSNLMVYGLLATPYQVWRQQNFTSAQLTNSAISGDTAAPAGDGIPNLMKYAFDLNPFVAGAGGLPVATVQNVSGSNYLAISYTRVLFATDISYTVQVSDDLVTWNSGPAFTAQLGLPIDNGDGTQTITVQDLVPVDSATKRFIRIRISHP